MRPRLTLVALAGSLFACGSPSRPTPSPTPTATPTPARTVIGEKSLSLPAGTSVPTTVDNIPPGALDARVDWASAANNLDLYATDQDCTGMPEILAGQCRLLAQATGTAKPERVAFTGTTTTNYVFWVRNLGPGTETLELEIGLTR